MAESAALLVDEVFPEQPMRQCVDKIAGSDFKQPQAGPVGVEGRMPGITSMFIFMAHIPVRHPSGDLRSCKLAILPGGVLPELSRKARVAFGRQSDWVDHRTEIRPISQTAPPRQLILAKPV
jgi:hypothetical protein